MVSRFDGRERRIGSVGKFVAGNEPWIVVEQNRNNVRLIHVWFGRYRRSIHHHRVRLVATNSDIMLFLSLFYVFTFLLNT